MKLAYVATYDPLDPRAFGGRGAQIFRCISDHFDVECHAPLRPRRWSMVLRAKKLYYHSLVGKRWYSDSREGKE